MKSRDINEEVTRDYSRGSAELPLPSQQIKSVSPMTFSQKLYQSRALEIAEEYEQALESNSLEKIKSLLDKVLELEEPS